MPQINSETSSSSVSRTGHTVGKETSLLPDFFHCPICRQSLTNKTDSLWCSKCAKDFSVAEQIPRLFIPNDWDPSLPDITEQMKSFYEKTPFPNYDEFDNLGTLITKARKGVFAKLLDDQIPFGASVLECGCGTGQLTNFLSMGNRTVIGSDMCMNSLKLAQDFKDKMKLDRAHFVQMNLFRPSFAPKSFDVVISNGVLHHTSDAKKAFTTIADLVRPQGYLIVGLYHKYGRLFNDARRHIFNATNDRFRFLDSRMRNKKQGAVRKETWFADQYKNPHESKHTIAEVKGWLEEIGFSFVSSIPKARMFDPVRTTDNLFKPQQVAGKIELTLHEALMVVTNHKDSGFFVVIGKRNG